MLLLFSSDPNFSYFLKLNFSLENSLLFCKVKLKQKKIIPKILIVPLIEYSLVSKISKSIKIIQYKDKKELIKILKKIKKKIKERKMFLNYKDITLAQLKLVKKVFKRFEDVSELIEEIRCIKNSTEVRNIKRACAITNNIIKKIRNIVKPGKSEKEVSEKIKRLIESMGGEVAFPTIVASGKNSSNPHFLSGKRKIRKGDVVIVDFGCKYNGYCSDVTRTIIIGKNPEAKEIYEKVEKAMNESLKIIMDNVKVKDLQKLAEKIIGEKMIHSIAHSIGREVHEPIPKGKLKENMVICIEPAVYKKNFGIRIENVVLVKKNSCVVLTK